MGTAEEGFEVVFEVIEFDEVGGGVFALLKLDCVVGVVGGSVLLWEEGEGGEGE